MGPGIASRRLVAGAELFGWSAGRGFSGRAGLRRVKSAPRRGSHGATERAPVTAWCGRGEARQSVGRGSRASAGRRRLLKSAPRRGGRVLRTSAPVTARHGAGVGTASEWRTSPCPCQQARGTAPAVPRAGSRELRVRAGDRPSPPCPGSESRPGTRGPLPAGAAARARAGKQPPGVGPATARPRSPWATVATANEPAAAPPGLQGGFSATVEIPDREIGRQFFAIAGTA
jgi:hypothetical protein